MEMGNTHIPESDNHRLMEHQQPQSFLLGLWALNAPGVRLAVLSQDLHLVGQSVPFTLRPTGT